jgi:antitoxin StbD
MTDITTSISEFKVNPNREVAKAGNKPFAVLTNNKPSFYVLSVEAFDEIMEKLWEAQIAPTLLDRRKRLHEAVEVNLEDI